MSLGHMLRPRFRKTKSPIDHLGLRCRNIMKATEEAQGKRLANVCNKEIGRGIQEGTEGTSQ